MAIPLFLTGFWPVRSSNTRAARVRRSPDSPTEMFSTSLSTWMACILLFFLVAAAEAYCKQ